MTTTEQEKDYRYLGELSSYQLVQELWDRDSLDLAVREYRRRTPWWTRFRLSDKVWGFSSRWLAVCPWNGEDFWITLPFFYFSAGKMHVETRFGGSKYGVTFDIRWRWE